MLARVPSEAFAVLIAIGNVQMLPDEYVLTDRDGIVLIPSPQVQKVIKTAEKKLATKGGMVKAIRVGMDSQKAYLKHRVF